MKSNNKSIIAENIKKYRNKMGVSQDRLSKFSVRIFAEKSSDFVQDRQHCTIFSIFRLVLRLAASRLGAVWGQISEIFFVLRAKKI